MNPANRLLLRIFDQSMGVYSYASKTMDEFALCQVRLKSLDWAVVLTADATSPAHKTRLKKLKTLIIDKYSSQRNLLRNSLHNVKTWLAYV
jgi:hypothetical protein